MDVLATQKIWRVKNPNPSLQAQLSNALRIHPIVAQLLVNRGITAVEEGQDFFSSDLSRLHDPFLLKDMDKAVARVRQAAQQGERVLVYGDYDVDGVASSAILVQALRELGLDVINRIPHRMSEGYGLNANVAQYAKEQEVDLLITVDCGITSLVEAKMFKALGIDVIIFDHHEPAEEGLPEALAVVDPKRKDCPYPFKYLASVGLMAKFLQALFGKVREDFLDLVALGTIADVVPLRGENRIFVKTGVPRISETGNLGLAALLEVAKIKGKKFKPYYAGFIIGPRINATGRMDSAQKSLDLLLSQDSTRAYQLAKELEGFNTERQKLQREVIQEAMEIIEREINFNEQKVIVVSREGWHKGVLGIVASRIAETYYRPSIVISLNEGVGTASARSIAGFHLHEALSHCSGVLENFGGHKLAAGLTIREDNIERFRELINVFARDILEVRDLIPALNVDCEIALSSLSLDLVNKVESLEPFGEGNPEPVFCSRQLTVKGQPQTLGKDTLKFWVTDGDVTISAVGFGMAKYRDMLSPGQKIDLAYQLAIDDWNKAPTVQIKLKDIKESQP